MSTGLVFVRAQEARAERQAEGAVEVIERGLLTVLAQGCQGVSKEGPARSLQGGDWSPAISDVGWNRIVVGSKRQPRSSLRHRPPDHRPAPQPAWTTWRTGDAESSQGPCDTHGPQAGSGSRLEAARIGRSFGEGQPLMGQGSKAFAAERVERLFCVSSGDRSLHASLGLWMSTPTALRLAWVQTGYSSVGTAVPSVTAV